MHVIPLRRARPADPVPEPDGRGPTVDVAVPVYNEEAQLGPAITTLRAYLDRRVPWPAHVTIVDNASTDGTWRIARRLADAVPGVTALHLDAKGRGLALRAAWSTSTAPVVAYMDVDLSTGLDAFVPLVAPVLSGHSDLSIGTRLGPGARVVRGARRELISRAYNLVLKTALRTRISDAQCGFKAMRRDLVDELLPLVEDDAWFFDTELLVLAQQGGLRIHEVPVDWVDDPDSRVDLIRTALADLRGIGRMLRQGRARHFATPRGPSGPTAEDLRQRAGFGAAATLEAALAFAALRPLLGLTGAALVAVLGCGVLALAATRRRSGSSPTPHRRCVAAGAVATAAAVAFTGAAVAVLSTTDATSIVVGAGAIACASLASAIVRFAVLRSWVYPTGIGHRRAGDHREVPPLPYAAAGADAAAGPRSVARQG